MTDDELLQLLDEIYKQELAWFEQESAWLEQESVGWIEQSQAELERLIEPKPKLERSAEFTDWSIEDL